MIFDIENWLWKSNFGTFWQLAINPKLKTQNSIISFEYVDFSAKNLLILYPPFENSTTRIAIMKNIVKHCEYFFWYVFENTINLLWHCQITYFCPWSRKEVEIKTFTPWKRRFEIHDKMWNWKTWEWNRSNKTTVGYRTGKFEGKTGNSRETKTDRQR